MARLRLLWIYLAALACLGALAGERLWRPSEANHYTHLAAAWLDGRLAHDGNPPGYDARRHDDWGRVWEVELRDGAAVEGVSEGRFLGTRCARADCVARRRKERVETWLTQDGRELAVPVRQIKRRASTWYVTFPPAPALVMLPGVAALGLAFPDLLLTVLAAALIPVILVRLCDRERGREGGRGHEHLWIAAAFTVASPACWVAVAGGVWFTAQIFGALFVTLYLAASFQARRPALAGLWLALAVGCRVTPAFAAPFFLIEWWRAGRRPWALVRFLAPLVIAAVILATLNELRFGDPLEFGHRYLEIRWQRRIQELGMFSVAYLPRNLECALWLAPQVVTTGGPWLRWSQHGMGLLVGCPWLAGLVWARDRFPQRVGLWLTTALVAAPSLLYQNTGFRQFSYRFALDWLPAVTLLLAFGGAAKAGTRRWVFAALVLLGAALQVYGAYQWGRAPGRLFVHDLWWPLAPLPSEV
ncbi:MAG: hypothetical protein KC636_13670 [Myxococcales bacterium]|nr:hypothetical protein [Myxococcales bacterium]